MRKSYSTKNIIAIACIPFAYAIATRYSWPRNFLVNFVTAWMPGIILTQSITDVGMITSTTYYSIGYIIFICIYEIGYIANDTIGIKHDTTPRRRFNTNLKSFFYQGFIITRLSVFCIISSYFDLFKSTEFIVFYSSLAILLISHNLIKSVEFKFLTFIQLSVLRYTLPIVTPLIIFGKTEYSVYIVLIAVFTFTYTRLITYQDSKNRLHIPERNNFNFLLKTLFFLIPILAIISLLMESKAPAIIWLWLTANQLIYVFIYSLPNSSRLKSFLLTKKDNF